MQNKLKLKIEIWRSLHLILEFPLFELQPANWQSSMKVSLFPLFALNMPVSVLGITFSFNIPSNTWSLTVLQFHSIPD
jgi:hypothetical protein